MLLYNTLTRKKEEFTPLEPGVVKMYNCGPTVYNYIHVGNARPLVIFDTLRRYFIYKGYEARFVVNFTDIDDKMIRRANEEEVTVEEIANRYIDEFKKDATGLGFYDYETTNPRATHFIAPIIEFIEGLIEKGAAYESDGDVYFNIEAAKDYGKLSKKKLEDLIAGARVDVSELKKNPVDFALWKKKKEGEPSWPSPWGEGRPGWHIECSVMAKSLLGETIDIHSGGEDLQFPHHENEIAQSETLTGKTFARFWLHNGMITVDNEKMSKSKGNFFTVREVAKEFDLEVLRMFLLSSHYRGPINFSRDVMEQTKRGLERLYNAKHRLENLLERSKDGDEDQETLKELEAFKKDFIDAMEDDINTADALSALFGIARLINTSLNEDSSKTTLLKVQEIYESLSKVLGLLHKEEEESLDEESQRLFDERVKARQEKDWARSDELRDALKERGILVEDSRQGTTWKRI